MGLYQAGRAREVPLSSFAPDADHTQPGILLDMSNAQPTTKGFRPLPAPAQHTSALPDTPLGSTIAQYAGGGISVIAGTRAHLYRSVGGSWQVADSTTWNLQAGEFWRFTQFNNDVIAVSAGTAPQVANGPNGTFQPLGGGPPFGAPLVVAVAGFVLMFRGDEWFSSAAGLDNDWTPSVQTLAANGTLYDFPGGIVATARIYRSPIAWKQNAMWIGSFVGAPSTWSWQLVADFTGTWGQGCVVELPDAVAFLGSDDFYVTTGYAPQRIPNDVKEWFFRNAEPSKLPLTLGRYDIKNSTVYWHFISTESSDLNPVPDLYVAWNVRNKRWAKGRLRLTDAPAPNTVPRSPSRLYFDTSNVLQSLSGDPGQMRLRTGWFGDPGRITQLFRVRGKYATYPTDEELVTKHVYRLGEAEEDGPSVVLGSDGWHNCRQTDRYHAVELVTEGDCELVGFDYEAREAGIR